jgi:MinD superfamily P-loop ATPase
VIEIVVLSGKGGTGKTTLTAAFAHLSRNHILCDLDVDAPDLHLLLHPQKIKSEPFFSGHEARIVSEHCQDCGLCGELCRYGAVVQTQGAPRIDPLKCEGCKVCVAFCPAAAIDFPEKHCGEWYLSNTRFGRMVHAQLFAGEENSGKLVALLRNEARELAKQNGVHKILSDGPPGIGCPVISSLSGASLAVIVTEPTPSGHHDLERIVGLCRHFQIPAGVIINKFDLSPHNTDKIERLCASHGLELLGRLPHDEAVVHAVVQGLTVTEYQPDRFSETLRRIWAKIEKRTEIPAAA